MTHRNHAWRLVVAGVALFAAGVLAAWLVMRTRDDRNPVSAIVPVTPGSATAAAAGAVTVDLPADVAARAGIATTEVGTANVGAAIRIPGTVEPNEYTVVAITAPAGGRVLRVLRQLGDSVGAGTPVAVLHSPDLSRAAADQSAAASALGAIDRDIDRLRKLVAIGAASRRELEAREADRAEASSRVEAARAEVRLLGGAGNRSGEMTIRADAPGIVIERAANAGMVLERGAPIMTTASLSPVWVIGDLAEADMARVRVGDKTAIRSDAFPGPAIEGRVTYLAPEVRRETRTAQIRIETPNTGGRLRLGMLVEVVIEGGGVSTTLAVPASAVQRVGSKTVAYVSDSKSSSRFEERVIEIGVERQGMVEVRSGLRAGERVVSAGSFLLRAEVDRQGLRPSVPAAAESAASRIVPIAVDAAGFTPSRIEMRQGDTITLRFTRVSESCATEVVVPELGMKRELPLKQPVDISFQAPRTGEFAFTCGMNMLRGAIVVQ